MTVRVLFFGATADIVGRRELDLEIGPSSSAGEVFKKFIDDYPRLASHKLHLAINQEYANGGETLRDGDELAVFTAVSGG